jgi:hypothetical protein
MPVSSVAGFIAPLTRSPFTPGSVAEIASVTAAGSSTPIGVPSKVGTIAVAPSTRYLMASPTTSSGTWACS